MKSLLVMIVLVGSVAQAETVKELSANDAAKALDAVSDSGAIQAVEDIAAYKAKIRDVLCSIDKEKMSKEQLIEIQVLKCNFKKESGEAVEVTDIKAMKLKEVLLANEAEVIDAPNYAAAKAKELELFYHTHQHTSSGKIKK